jgi:hypothetical protein
MQQPTESTMRPHAQANPKQLGEADGLDAREARDRAMSKALPLNA